ncbi:MAG: response regulator [Gammaproteobacteria bacterium]|nr:MAG: response regulator [Gammaproteobacteria bacterium]
MKQILIVEDEKVIRTALKRLLERNGYYTRTAGSVDEANSQSDLNSFDLIISDLRLPGEPGTQLIQLVKHVPILIMTSYSSLKSAVEAMRMGAADYIAKPFNHEEMLSAIARILDATNGSQTKPNAPSKASLPANAAPQRIKGIIGSCQPMEELFTRISKVAPTDTTVLILGESGTGKELVAQALHDISKRSKGPVISVNCAAIPENLIESELFGHEKGAFTGAHTRRQGLVEAANGGTLFLDEIGELPFEAQARLLRLLQEKEIRRVGSVNSQKIDVRLVAATHRNLKQLAKDGQFREDLYYRLNVVALRLPPLRDRGADITELAHVMLKKYSAKIDQLQLQFSECALDAMNRYHWPGNVRELENAIERAVILCDSDLITSQSLSLEIEPLSTPPSPNFLASEPEQHEPDSKELPSLEDYFQRFVLENQDNMTETALAQKLGVSRKCLWERRQRLGIPRKKTQK